MVSPKEECAPTLVISILDVIIVLVEILIIFAYFEFISQPFFSLQIFMKLSFKEVAIALTVRPLRFVRREVFSANSRYSSVRSSPLVRVTFETARNSF